MRELIISKKNNGKKLSTILLSEYPGLTLNTLNKAYRKKDIRVNGVKISENTTVFENDKITIYITDEYLYKNSNISVCDLIVYEDDNIIVLNKPSGICVQSDTNNEVSLEALLTNYADGKYIAKPCHRLDRNTCGLVIFAKNNIALEELLYCFKERLIDKYYLCKVYGILKEKNKLLKHYLFKDSQKNIVNISDKKLKGYEEIQTKYLVKSENKAENTSILEVELLTGKTHQIRAHLAYIGFPIIGDGKYGNGNINKKFKQKTQLLFAYKVVFHTKDLNLLSYLNEKEISITVSFN
ncbi:MAG: RluA family pseudouridine synthase [Clostridiales bacterium]|nr:RluA family pseudouridine synthase [Clostridiales bacterium]